MRDARANFDEVARPTQSPSGSAVVREFVADRRNEDAPGSDQAAVCDVSTDAPMSDPFLSYSFPNVLGAVKLDAAGRRRLAEAMARVRATEAAWRAGSGQIVMMAASAAKRMKLLRDRQRAGIRVANPEIEEITLIDRLIDDGRISEEASADPKKVDAAISELLRDYCTSALRVTRKTD